MRIINAARTAQRDVTELYMTDDKLQAADIIEKRIRGRLSDAKNKYSSLAPAVEALYSEIDELKERLFNTEATPKVTTDTLRRILNTSVRTPLAMTVVNDFGERMDDAALKYFNENMYTRLNKVTPTTVAIDVPVPTAQVSPGKKVETPKRTPADIKRELKESWEESKLSPVKLPTVASPLVEALRLADLSNIFIIEAEPGKIPEERRSTIAFSYRDDKGRQVIVVNPAAKAKFTTEYLLHEVTHAVTSEAINNPVTEKDQALVARLTELKNAFDAYVKEKGFKLSDYVQDSYSGWNLKEFVANLSNPKFADLASKIKIENSNLLSKFFQALFEFLGISESNVYELTLRSLELYLKPEETQALVYTDEMLMDMFPNENLYKDAIKLLRSKKTDEQKALGLKKIQDSQAIESAKERGFDFASDRNVFDLIVENPEYTDEVATEIIDMLVGEKVEMEDELREDVFKLTQLIAHGKNRKHFHKVMTLFISIPQALEAGLNLTYMSAMEKASDLIYKTLLSSDEKRLLIAELQAAKMLAKDPSTKEIMQALQTAQNEMAEEDLPYTVEQFKDRLTALAGFFYQYSELISDTLSTQDIKLKKQTVVSAAPTKSAAYIDAYFGSTTQFRIARNLMYAALYRATRQHVEDHQVVDNQLMLSKEESIQVAYRSLRALRASLLKLKNPGALELQKLRAIESLLIRNDAGEEVFYTMLGLVYPNFKAAAAEDIELYSELLQTIEEDENDGLKNEVEDQALVNEEGRQSDAVKEFLSFIPNENRDNDWHSAEKYINSSHVFVVAATMLAESFSLQLLDSWKAQEKAHSQNEAYVDNQIKNELSFLVFSAKEDLTRYGVSDVRFHIIESKFTGSKVRVIQDAKLANESYNSPLIKNAAYTIIHDGGNAALYQKLLKAGVVQNMLQFNVLMNKAKAEQTLRDLQNSVGSLVEKQYMIGEKKYNALATKKNPDAGLDFYYNEATAFGASKSYLSYVRESLRLAHEKHGFGDLSNRALTVLRSEGMKNLEKLNVLFKIFQLTDVFGKVSNVGPQTLYAILTEFEQFADRNVNFKLTDPADDALEDSGSLMNALTKLAKEQSMSLRATSILNGGGKMMYKLTKGSFFYDVVQYLRNAKDKEVPGATGTLEFLSDNRPEFLVTDYYKNYNIFVRGENKIFQYVEHDSLKNHSTGGVKTFLNENSSDFASRMFSYAFLDRIRKNKQGRYIHFLLQPSDKPRLPGVELNLMSIAESKRAIAAAIRQTLEPYPLQEALGRDKPNHIMFSLLDKALEAFGMEKADPNRIDELVDWISNQLEEQAIEQMDYLLENNAELYGKVGTIYNKITQIGRKDALGNEVGKTLYDELGMADLKMKPWIATRKSNEKYNEEEVKRHYMPLVRLFMYNEMANAYHVNQLFTGPYNMYKSMDDIVKRMAGVLAPGVVPLVDKDFGAKEKFAVGIIGDEEKGRDTIVKFLKDIVPGITDDRIDEMLSFFEAFKSTDAQGFMSQRRWADLHKGYGSSYGLGKVMKPVYFDILVEDGQPRPIYIKYSSVVLTDELMNHFPEFRKVQEFMDNEENMLDELVFNSTIKVGNPPRSSLLSPSELGNRIAPPYSKVMLNNSKFRLQFNAKSRIDKKPALFSQLTYFLNILGKNNIEAKAVYDALNYLYMVGAEEFSNLKIRNKVTESMNSPGSEAIKELLDAGISLSNPLVSPKVVAQISSILEKLTVKVKFKGAALILQTEQFTNTYRNPNYPKRDKPLQFIRTASSYYAESFVPKGIIPKELEDAVRRGEDVYLTSDMFGFRLPSTELHSAVPLKIVGIYDSQDTNVIIVPFEIVYLHGSDHDVDKLTCVVRERFTPVEAQLLGVNKDIPVGYELRGKKLIFNSELVKIYMEMLDENIAKLQTQEGKMVDLEIQKYERAKEEIKQKFAKQIIIENMLQALTNPVSRERVSEPINMSIFNNPNNKESALAQMQKDGIEIKGKEQLDLSLVKDRYKAFAAMQDGARLTGVFANAMKALAYLATASEENGPAMLREDLR